MGSSNVSGDLKDIQVREGILSLISGSGPMRGESLPIPGGSHASGVAASCLCPVSPVKTTYVGATEAGVILLQDPILARDTTDLWRFWYHWLSFTSMAASKIHIFALIFLFFALIFTLTEADAAVKELVVGSDNSEASRLELDKLTSKIQLLESLVEKKNQELETKDETIAQKEKAIAEKEKIILEKSDSITSLKNQAARVILKGFGEIKGLTEIRGAWFPPWLDARLSNAESQWKEHGKPAFESLKQKALEKIKEPTKIRGAWFPPWLDARLSNAESHWKEHGKPAFESLKQKALEKIKEPTKIRGAWFSPWLDARLSNAESHWKEHGKPAFESLKQKALEKIKEPTKIRGAWFPPWLDARLSNAESHWKEHGKPAFESLKRKALEKKAQAERWAEPHVQKWVPAAREHWVLVVTNVEPLLQSLTKKTKEVYIQSKDALSSCLIKVKEVVDPHFQEIHLVKTVKKVAKPYIDHIATATKPVDKARETVAPYSKEVVISYGKFLESATKYHHQIEVYFLQGVSVKAAVVCL
ncbi:hypothetical protein R6Q59_004362 [Mikania micrantha]